MDEELAARWTSLRARVEPLLADRLRLGPPLEAVARYALEGGKRLRPLLVELVGEAVGAPPAALAEAGVAVEYLHAASLVLDDLPCMDDARERRGRPAVHVRFTQAEAILAAVALLARSTAVLLDAPVDAATARSLGMMAGAAAATMASGQAVETRGAPIETAGEVRVLHERKTGSLFTLAARLAVACAPPDGDATKGEALAAFATYLGRAYQIIDDLEDRQVPGEAGGNLVRLVGEAAARTEARELLRAAREGAAGVGAGSLVSCAAWLEKILRS